MADLDVEVAAGQYYLLIGLSAGSEAEALDAALRKALGVNSRVGMPPHGIRVSEEELRRQAIVMTDREVFYDGYDVAVSKRLAKSPEAGPRPPE
jgi:hypothetical protein